MIKTRRIVILSLTLLVMATTAMAESSWNNLTAAQWQKDLDLIVTDIDTKHQMPWRRISRADFMAEVDQLREAMPNMTGDESLLGLMKIVTLLEDGHSKVLPIKMDEDSVLVFPVRFKMFEEGLYVTAIGAQWSSTVGRKIVRIGRVPTDEALEKIGEVASGDNRFSRLYAVQFMLSLQAVMQPLGLSEPDGSLLLTTIADDGLEQTIAISAVYDATNSGLFDSMDDVAGGSAVRMREIDSSPQIMAYQDLDANYWYRRLPSDDVMYVQFQKVRNGDDETFAEFVERLFTDLDANPPRRVILDMRLNGGGNNQLLQPLIHGFIRRPEMTETGHLVVLIGRKTFSAAMNACAWLERHVHPVFIGEPSGASPNHPGDNRQVSGLNSKLMVRISRMWWLNTQPWDRREFIAPDYYVAVRADDYLAHRDPALALALSDENLVPALQALRQSIDAGDTDGGVGRYKGNVAAHPNPWKDDEVDINNTAYQLMGAGQYSDAGALFELNTEMFAGSANAWDSLAEWHMNQGHDELAIEYYEKAIEINPKNNPGAQENLENLKHKNR